GLVEALGAAVREALRVRAQEGLQVAARVALERRQQVAGLNRRRVPRYRDHAALGELGGRRRAGLEVDEEVALEEDARPDLELRALLYRAPLALALHGHLS